MAWTPPSAVIAYTDIAIGQQRLHRVVSRGADQSRPTRNTQLGNLLLNWKTGINQAAKLPHERILGLYSIYVVRFHWRSILYLRLMGEPRGIA